MIQVYLLAVRELCCQMEKMAYRKENPNGSSSINPIAADLPGWDKLADWQQEKILLCANPGARALCMGGQLLLQFGAYAWSVCDPLLQSELISWRIIDFSRLPEYIPAPQPLAVAYEPKGKPYICHVPWYYNLSHSGDYVALAISDAPVGIDIQQKRPYKDSLVKRFFCEVEATAYESLFPTDASEQEMAVGEDRKSACIQKPDFTKKQLFGDRETLFYTLWCRKEAYGKLLGTGLTEDVLKRNMLEDVGVHLYEYGELPGYCVCVCSEEG